MQKKLSITFKHTLSPKYIYVAALSTCLIAVVAFAVLSHLIAEDNRKNTEDFARKTFFRKYESVENEFRNIEDYQYLLRELIQKDGLKNYRDYSLVLNDLNKKEICLPTAGITMITTKPGSMKATIPYLIFSKSGKRHKDPLQ